MREKKGTIKKVKYHLKVEHQPGDFDKDMDLLIGDPVDAYQQLQMLKEKYQKRKIEITKITETKIVTISYGPITEGQLEELMKDK